jgi:hypothetical protein
MISVEQAWKIAKGYSDVDTYIDEPKAYIFTIKNPRPDQMDDNEVVVMKKDGRVVPYIHYIKIKGVK